MKRQISKRFSETRDNVTVEIHDNRYLSGIHEISYHLPSVLTGAGPIMVAVVSRIFLKPAPSRWSISMLGAGHTNVRKNRKLAHDIAMASCIRYEREQLARFR